MDACEFSMTSCTLSERDGYPESPPSWRSVVEPVASAGQDLVDVRLVAGVPEQHVTGAVEHPVQGHRELHHPEVRSEVAAGAADLVDQEVADLLGQLGELRRLRARRSAGDSMSSSTPTACASTLDGRRPSLGGMGLHAPPQHPCDATRRHDRAGRRTRTRHTVPGPPYDSGVTAPPGWPRAVPDPESPEFADRVVGWLLDLCPPDYRGHHVLRRHPVILARLAPCTPRRRWAPHAPPMPGPGATSRVGCPPRPSTRRWWP